MRNSDRIAAAPKAESFTVTEDQMVSDAVATMAERNYGAAIVVDAEKKAVGIRTERDVIRRIVDPGIDARSTTVGAVMTHNPSVARESDEIESWRKTMSQKRFRRMPVIDGDGRITAVRTQTGLMAYA